MFIKTVAVIKVTIIEKVDFKIIESPVKNKINRNAIVYKNFENYLCKEDKMSNSSLNVEENNSESTADTAQLISNDEAGTSSHSRLNNDVNIQVILRIEK